MGWGDLPITHLELLVTQEWLRRQWNEPNRGDFYAMAVRHELRYLRAEKIPGVNYGEKYGIKFRFDMVKTKTTEELEEDEIKAEEDAINASRFALAASVGLTDVPKYVSPRRSK